MNSRGVVVSLVAPTRPYPATIDDHSVTPPNRYSAKEGARTGFLAIGEHTTGNDTI